LRAPYPEFKEDEIVKITVRRWRLALRVLALALAVAAIPLPSLAQEKSPPAARPGIQASIQKAVAQTPVMPAKVQAARTQGTTAAPAKPSFFKTPAGLAVIGILAAGTGYAFYASSHDRIHSVVRSGQ
jgi:putative exporter of polyketide antibiotics